jgi:predicted metal-dependent phosphoesterase TrpH
MKADLHIHSNCSDGDYSPQAIAEKCFKKGLDIISLTDHDSINGVAQIKEHAQKYNLKVVSGVELSAFEGETETHILAYGFDYNDLFFNKRLIGIQRLREIRNQKIIDRLKTLGINIDYEQLKQKYRGEIIGRSHIARQMVNMGISFSVPDAFETHLASGGLAYVKNQRLTVEEAINLALEYNAIPVLAHPAKLSLSNADSEKFVRKLVEMGLKGIEAEYFSHTKPEREFFNSLADKYNLYVFGGSDFHSESYGIGLGAFYTPNEATMQLLISLTEK